eukprot:gnl/TRDRNA2_/TRDRNA2_73809_c1_seq1.p1 gnl/TRDRNA2_/TRDRNA2_73809_c1~~gnl/TRDRNA2_/TRDRNA2_73809_c1_seq1.p1  ORF type:complete len:211 (+),score=41.50 gnl/TRDRNA2_/TRDRNA2_73809_c1_seq1:55-633(+)
MTPLQKLLLQGLTAFCIIQLITAVYCILTTVLEKYGICKFHPSFCTLDKYLFGAVSGLSALAIMNLVVFERTLGHYVHSLQPKIKFFYAKCLLSVTCMQQGILSFLAPYLRLTDLENDLLYASLVCIECFFLSLLNWRAWHPEAAWQVDIMPNPREFVPTPKTEVQEHSARSPAMTWSDALLLDDMESFATS